LKLKAADIKDVKLAADGQNLIDWASARCPCSG